ncbi:helix-turn-helix domain-containing protein [Tissierella sp. P1]
MKIISSQAQIPLFLGTTYEHLNRAFKEFESQSIIKSVYIR